MSLKYDFSYMSGSSNSFWGVMVEINNATNGLFSHGIIILILIVLAYSFIKSTQDIGKSLVSSLFISSIISLILYYAGKSQGVVFITDIFLFGLLVVTAISIGGLFYARNNI